MPRLLAAVLLVGLSFGALSAEPPPVIDVHMHAIAPCAQGPTPLAMCTPLAPFPAWDGRGSYGQMFMGLLKYPPLQGNHLFADHRRGDAAAQSRGHAATQRPRRCERVATPYSAGGSGTRALPCGVTFNLGVEHPSADQLRKLHLEGRPAVPGALLGIGRGTGHSCGDPYGTGTAGHADARAFRYWAAMSSPLALEPVLDSHPHLRVYVMHAGSAMLDDMLALLFASPLVYVETGIIDYAMPRAGFYRYLKVPTDGGFANRILYGSDQMIWPEAVGRSIQVIEGAAFLSE